ncbi:hypothetical protein AAV94_14225 [Lampropedia cohaerens]|uniref:Tetratricopeptide repeat protein n=1 Tax=Lampropedia cohaerens TaxID=1610491 RepID=A0A0U1PWF4_9BURK|nr:hypothetical protein [Lampropedia cohaerens]KKW66872.1 hypothetical protein AAV94_14225 [Lampropedia cohaerens]
MWDRIKQLWQKKKHKPTLSLSEAQQFALLDSASQALQQGHYEQAERAASQLVDSQVPAIATDAMRTLGLVYFRQQKYAQAWPVFEQLALRTDTISDWFNVVSSATLAGELQRGSAAFERAVKAHDASTETPALSIASMHHYYACALRDRGEHAMAFEHVQVLRALYEKLPQTDARLLELRGFPRLDAVLEMMTDVLAHSGDIPEAESWLRDFGSQLRGQAHSDIETAIQRLHHLAAQLHGPTPDAPPTPPRHAGGAPRVQDNDPRLD